MIEGGRGGGEGGKEEGIFDLYLNANLQNAVVSEQIIFKKMKATKIAFGSDMLTHS